MMNPIWLLLAGMGIGLAVAVPIGPVNILAVSTTLRDGRIAGLVAGLGGLVADTLVAAIAAFGVTAVIDFVAEHARGIQLVGGAVLILFGIATLRSHPHLLEGPFPSRWPGHRALAAFVMTVTNPAALLGMLALFGSIKPLLRVDAMAHTFVADATMVAGVAAGGALWWTTLAFGVAALRTRIDDHWLEVVNRFAGLIVCGAGIALAARAIWAWLAN